MPKGLRRYPKAEFALPMLPGFRFLFAAIVLSMSIMVFGLGAAALLRTAHEEFASNPSWRAAPETTFAQQSESRVPVLAMLRVDPLPAEKAPDDVPAVEQPVASASVASAPAEPEKIAALTPEDSSSLETAKPEIPVAESPAQGETAPAHAEAAAGETKIAATEPASSPANEAAAIGSEQTSAPASPEAGADSAKIAALDAPTVTIEAKPPAKTMSAKTIGAEPDRSVIKRRLQARRAAQRRRIAARARLARQALQQAANPFAQPFAQPSTARTR
jgi:hypothetical protein